LPTSLLPPMMLHQRRLIGRDNSTSGNSTIGCMSYITRAKCLDASCEWRTQFSSCRDQVYSPSNVNRGQRGRHNRPHWATFLLSIG
jgi:hypothetical protein